jgi:hypothetical protein
LQIFAGAFTIAQMIFEAYFELPLLYVGRGKVQFTGAQLNIRLYKIQQLPHFGYRGKRAQVFGAIIDFPAGKKNPREIFFFNNNVGIRFIIFEVDVKTRLKLFNQRVLEQEGILFTGNNGELYALYTLNQLVCFVRGERFGKIRAYPLAEVFCFSHVKQGLRRVEVFINTGINR